MTRNEILYSLNKPDDFILAIVEFLDGDSHRVGYIRQPFRPRAGFRGDERELRDGGLAGPGPRSHHEKAASKKPRRKATINRSEAVVGRRRPSFDEVLALIDAAKARAVAAVNTTLIELYWSIGEYISQQDRRRRLGPGNRRGPGRDHPAASSRHERVSPRSNLWRMRQFFETYRDQPKLAALLRELSWTHNLRS